eukprot:CAMPEP_0197607642 /NCGR_PEP_ID=MMETSP1326-20131121/47500_1 /TAXON_ID=1155430 /ORGANISM="Genus nov. species nov., Strain RCC2288" /LENGTH=77 /DNA_ID=CAMNT_0043175719 /DNA_START=31 /DNA_END=260 /DNA_ORIENTATION=-
MSKTEERTTREWERGVAASCAVQTAAGRAQGSLGFLAGFGEEGSGFDDDFGSGGGGGRCGVGDDDANDGAAFFRGIG